MNYYIDFDSTLFDTSKLVEKMLNAIVRTSKLNILDECKSMFNREHIYDIYELAKYFEKKYNLDKNSLVSAVDYEINNCEDLIFSDVIPFLKKLKSKGHNVYMLTFNNTGLQYQIQKITGSKISDLFDGIFITSKPKYNLDIEYKNGIFIDDNPTDLEGLYSKNPLKLIRIKRDGNKYSDKIININIDEIKSFDEISI